jgi:hypothetical protein
MGLICTPDEYLPIISQKAGSRVISELFLTAEVIAQNLAHSKYCESQPVIRMIAQPPRQ